MVLFFSALTMLVSAWLLSWIQPLCAKIILPNYGGVPMVWNTCMVFFQMMVLSGYLYAHFLGRKLAVKTQFSIHFILVVCCLAFLPILWQQPPIPTLTLPSVSLLLALIFKLGLPVFLCASTSPMVQNWLSNSTHTNAKDPYFLYSASNIGSMLALISFPFLLEPLLGLQRQSWMWSGVFVLYLLLLTMTMLLMPKAESKPLEIKSELTWQRKCHWVLLAIVPSSLFLGVTQQITTDLPAIPFLWILPLFIYFLSFVITFAQKPILSHQWIKRNFTFFLIFPTLLLSSLSTHSNIIEALIFHLLGLFAVCMMCHGELVASRPNTDRLTEFYCWLALGGLLGGVFNTFVAPFIFSGIVEYPIAVVASVLLFPSLMKWKDWDRNDSIFIIVLGIALIILQTQVDEISLAKLKSVGAISLMTIIAVTFYYSDRHKRFAVALALLFLFGIASQNTHDKVTLVQSRNFFGVKRVIYNKDLHMMGLTNGSTLHGVQIQGMSGLQNLLTAYFTPTNQIALAIQSQRKNPQVAVIGLGVGTMACQFSKSRVALYEIDPVVVNLAQDTDYFTYLQDCPNHSVIIGDGRLELKKQPAHSYDVLVLDAFTSDSIPIHLLTQEAIHLYKEKLKENGVLVFNISQRHLDLTPIMRGFKHSLNMDARIMNSTPTNQYEYPSQWLVYSNDQNILRQLDKTHQWAPLPSEGKTLVWTDDYANLFSVLRPFF